MRQIGRRTAGMTAVIAAATLVAAACAANPTTSAAPDAGSVANAAGSVAADAPDSLGHSSDKDGTEQIQTPSGLVTISGAIGTKYADLGGRRGELGLPKSDEQDAPNRGKYQEFEGGAVYWSGQTGAHVLWGEIRNAWEQHGGAGGPYGYPISDEHDVTGGKAATFSGGKISWIDGQTQAYPDAH